MASLTCITDLRGKGRWLPTDYERTADLWIIGDPWAERPPVAGRVLAYINPAVLILDGKLAGEPGSFSQALADLPLLDFPPIWTSDDGRQQLMAIDITVPGVLFKLAKAAVKTLTWADGVRIGYFTSLDWLAPGLFPLEFWKTWEDCLASWANELRRQRPGWLVLGSQFHLTSPVGSLNGLYLENSPYSFGQDIESHARDLAMFRALMSYAAKGREVLWVSEIAEPWRWDSYNLNKVYAWASQHGIYISAGRDATARGAQTTGGASLSGT